MKELYGTGDSEMDGEDHQFTKRLTIDIAPELHTRLRYMSLEKNTTMSKLVRELLKNWLERQKPLQPKLIRSKNKD